MMFIKGGLSFRKTCEFSKKTTIMEKTRWKRRGEEKEEEDDDDETKKQRRRIWEEEESKKSKRNNSPGRAGQGPTLEQIRAGGRPG
jgi:hypothetical protein